MAVGIDRSGNLYSYDPGRASENVISALKKGTSPSSVSKRKSRSSSAKKRAAEIAAKQQAEQIAIQKDLEENARIQEQRRIATQQEQLKQQNARIQKALVAAKQKNNSKAVQIERQRLANIKRLQEIAKARLDNLKKRTYNIRDFVSGGKVTERAIVRTEETLQKRIENFNRKYAGKELSDQEYNIAVREQEAILRKQKEIDDSKANLERTLKRKLGNVISTRAAERSYAESLFTQKEIDKTKSNIKELESKLGKARSELNKRRLNLLLDSEKIKLKKQQERDYSVGKIIAGEPLPIIPAISLPTNTRVTFGGTSRAKGNLRVSNIKFQQLNKAGKVKQIGDAKIYTIGKGKSSVSITFGKVVKKAGQKPSQIVGVEGAISSAQKKAIANEVIRLTKGGKALSTVNVQSIVKGVKATGTIGGGTSAVIDSGVYAKNLSPKLRPYMKINTRDFGTISKAFTKNELTVLTGKTLTNKKDVVEFLGIVKNIQGGGTGGSSISGLSPSKLKQYQTALSQLSGTISSALAKTQNTFPTLKQAAVNSRAINLIKSEITPSKKAEVAQLLRKSSPSQSISEIKQVSVPSIEPVPRVITESNYRSSLRSSQNQSSIIREKQKEVEDVVQRIKQVSKQKLTTRQKLALSSKLKQAQKQAQKLRQAQRQTQRQIQQLRSLNFSNVSMFRLTPAGFVILKRKKKESKIIKKPVGNFGYDVYVKTGKRFIKANKKPLSENNAKNRAAYVVDHSTAVTARIVPVGKVSKLGVVNSKEYGARKKIKARTYKIKKKTKYGLINTIIERRGKPRINTRGEKRGLSAAKVLSQLQKRKVIKRKTTKTTKRKMMRR